MAMSDVQTVVFEHEGVTLCRFRCPADHARWQRENQITDGHNVAFPEVPVEIRHAGHPGRLVDPNLAVFYNDGDPYQRRINHPTGDSANIFLFDSAHLLPALAPFAPGTPPERPWPRRFGRVPSRTYLKQRLLLAGLVRQPAPEPMWVVEQAVEILAEVVTASYGEPASSPTREPPIHGPARDRVEAAKRLLSQRLDEQIPLSSLAAITETSVYHLCRIFRRQTGQTIHRYRQRLRLREGLIRLERSAVPLAELACDLGFAHQSHFTEAFRRAYGMPPGRLRQRLGP